MNLYIVVDESREEHPRDQVVSFFTDLGQAKETATDPDRVPSGTVYQLVEPGSSPIPELVVDLPMSDQRVRLHAAQLAVDRHKGYEASDAELVGCARTLGNYISDGTASAAEDDEPSKPDVLIRRSNNGHRRVEVHVDGELVAETDYDAAGWGGMDAVEKAAVAVAEALDVEVRREELER